MTLILKALNGPLAGKEFSVTVGDTFGRYKCTIELDDPKASNKHAKIEQDPSGELIVVDQNSTNGIRWNDKRVKRAALIPGGQLTIGNTSFLVEKAAPGSGAAPKPPALKPPTSSDPDDPPSPPVDWSAYLSAFSLKATEKVKNHAVSLQPFAPLLVLTFVRGPQLGTKMILGYGPRSVGLGSLDLPIYEDGAPPICFTVQCLENKMHFATEHPKKVLLNGKSVKADRLRAEDTIEIANTLIRVSFKE